MAIKQISVFAENKKGSVFSSLDVLADADIDLRALSIAETTEYGILRIIVSDTEKASEILKEAGCIFTVTDVIGVQMPDVPGGLARILGVLAKADINIEYLYAFLATIEDRAYVVLRVADNSVAEKELSKNGMVLLSEKEIKSF